MPGAIADYLRRSLVPSAIIAASRRGGPRTFAARLACRLGRPLPLELYFAYDDPYAAIALPALRELVAARPVTVRIYPLIERGIADDPAQQARTRHALADAQRLARRSGPALRRGEPLSAQDCAFLASWTAALQEQPVALAFAAEAITLLWRDSDGPVTPAPFEALHRQWLQQPAPPSAPGVDDRLRSNRQRLLARGHWESPAVRIAGEWFFAHERIGQIRARLDELGA